MSHPILELFDPLDVNVGKQTGSAERFDGCNNVGLVMEGAFVEATFVAYSQRTKS